MGEINWNRISDLIDRNKTSSIIIPHFYGVPTDFRATIDLAKNSNVSVIEDCAHTLGAFIKDTTAGTIGDYSIFSFNYDKPISLGGGGLLIDLKNENLINQKNDLNISYGKEKKELLSIKKALSFRRSNIIPKNKCTILFDSLMYKIGFRSNQIPNASGIGSARANLGIQSLHKYKNILKIRNKNALRIQNYSNKTWHIDENISPAWLRQKILGDSEEKNQNIINEMHQLGIRVGTYNWPRLHESIQTSSFPNAYDAATLGVDIPIHQNISEKQLSILEQIAGEL